MNLPLGYLYGAAYAGIRKVEKDDLALIVSGTPASTAAVFTTNMVKAAPVLLSQRHLKVTRGKTSALLINAGNANCATRTGERVALSSCKHAAKLLGVPVEEILPASTGVIGVELDARLIKTGVSKIQLHPESFEAVANAIMTTDTRVKMAFAEVDGIRIAGMTKGAGMIQPNMATTLAFVMTDAVITPTALKPILVKAVSSSFNALTVDGDMSTNDTLVLMANGASGKKPGRNFQRAVTQVLESLAEQIARDGEGARKLIVIETEGFRTNYEAMQVARSIANSPLVKTAVGGSDPNWGRILAAAGYSGVKFDPSLVDVYLQGVRVCRGGLAANFDESGMKKKLDADRVSIRLVKIGPGKGIGRIFTCDLTEEYIRINGSYRT